MTKEEKEFEEKLDLELDKLPYTKHLDDGQYNDGRLEGFEMGARWGKEYASTKQEAGQPDIEDIKKEGLSHLMALVRVGYSQAALDIAEYCEKREVPTELMDDIISMLNSDNKREFVQKLFADELKEVEKENPNQEKIKELVEATLIIGARRGHPGSISHDDAKFLIKNSIENITERFIKLFPYYNSHKQQEAGLRWVKASDLPPEVTVVLGYSPLWIDEDFEPEGIRESFYNDGIWNSAVWDNNQDNWDNDTVTKPLYWMQRPEPPKTI